MFLEANIFKKNITFEPVDRFEISFFVFCVEVPQFCSFNIRHNILKKQLCIFFFFIFEYFEKRKLYVYYHLFLKCIAFLIDPALFCDHSFIGVENIIKLKKSF